MNAAQAKQIKVVTAGRTDLGDFFRLHVTAWKDLKLSPLLVFRQSDSAVTVEIVTKPAELLAMPDETPVMGLWPGQWRSDFFQFTVGEYRHFVENKTNANS